MSELTGIVPTWFKPEKDNNKGVEFLIAPLSKADFLTVSLKGMESGYDVVSIIKKGVKDWKNIYDPKDKSVLPFKYENIDLAIENCMTVTMIFELAGNIVSMNKLKDDEIKNS